MAEYYYGSKHIFKDRGKDQSTILCDNLTCTNLSSVNHTVTNTTISNIVISNLTATNITATDIYSTRLDVRDSIVCLDGVIVSDIAYAASFTTGFLTSTLASITTATITNLNCTNLTATNITTTNLNLTSITSTNLNSTNATITNLTNTNLTSTSITSTNLTTTNILCTTMTFTNATGSSLVLTNTLGALNVQGPSSFEEDVTFYNIDVLVATMDEIQVDGANRTNRILSTTESTSVSTGCLVLSGGLGLAKTLYCNKLNVVSGCFGSVRGIGAQTISNATDTTLINTYWNQTATVQGSMTWTATSGSFVVPEAGTYLITVSIGMGSNGTGSRIFYINKNGAGKYGLLGVEPDNANVTHVTTSVVLQLVANDAITTRVWHNAGASLNTSTSDYGDFSVVKIF